MPFASQSRAFCNLCRALHHQQYLWIYSSTFHRRGAATLIRFSHLYKTSLNRAATLQNHLSYKILHYGPCKWLTASKFALWCPSSSRLWVAVIRLSHFIFKSLIYLSEIKVYLQLRVHTRSHRTGILVNPEDSTNIWCPNVESKLKLPFSGPHHSCRTGALN